MLAVDKQTTSYPSLDVDNRDVEIQDIEDVLAIERLAYKIPWNKAKFTHSLHNPNTVACLIFK
jgi:hypothetical protein